MRTDGRTDAENLKCQKNKVLTRGDSWRGFPSASLRHLHFTPTTGGARGSGSSISNTLLARESHSRYAPPLPLPPTSPDLSPPALDSFVRGTEWTGAGGRVKGGARPRYLIEDKRTRLRSRKEQRADRTSDRATAGRTGRTPMKPRGATRRPRRRLTNSPCLATAVPPSSRCAGRKEGGKEGGRGRPGIFHGLSASRVIMAFGTRSLARPSLALTRIPEVRRCCANMPCPSLPLSFLTSSRFCHAVQSKHGHLA